VGFMVTMRAGASFTHSVRCMQRGKLAGRQGGPCPWLAKPAAVLLSLPWPPSCPPTSSGVRVSTTTTEAARNESSMMRFSSVLLTTGTW